MNEIDNVIEIQDIKIKEDSSSFFQVDFLKTFMIAFVIIDHSLLHSLIRGTGTELWERMSIPVFLILLGFNMGNSFARRGDQYLSELYSWSYFKRKFWRFVFPYIILYIVSTTAGFIIYEENFTDTFRENWFLEYIVYQKSLLEGPGNWFIPILFQSILLLPLMYKLFSILPRFSLILSFLIEICFHLFVFAYVGEITIENIFTELNFRYIILLYISAIGMGFWFSKDHDLFSKKNLFVWILFPISVIYMVAWEFFGFRLEVDGSGIVRGDYNYFTFIYSAFIILIVMKVIPKNPKNKVLKIFTVIGRSTFHIYLVQDVYFAITYSLYGMGEKIVDNIFGISFEEPILNLLLLCLNWLICISAGVFWWYIENTIRKARKK
ncbi:MAG: acyltransferase [Candidatus Lokiarchaeota archaeon]|nr:acyltransferase [Candidatus Lokiarchaeota archaeon]